MLDSRQSHFCNNNVILILAEELGAELRKDDEFHADCPFCGKIAKKGQTHFSFWDKGANRQGFKCHVCGEGGSLYKLTKLLDIDLEMCSDTPRRPAPPARPTTDLAWSAYHARKLQTFQNALWHTAQGHAARRYLREQGYTDTTITALGLGFNPDWVATPFGKNEDKSGWIAPGIVYPHVDENGQLCGLHVRCPYQTKAGQRDRLAVLLNMEPAKSKVIWASGSVPKLGIYGNLDVPHAPLFITEGEKDRDNLWQHVPQLNVITLGSAGSTLPDWVLERIAALEISHIFIVPDNDEAGRNGAEKLYAQLSEHHPAVAMVSVPASHKDISDWILAGGAVDAWVGKLRRNIAGDVYFQEGLPDGLTQLLLNLNKHIHADFLADHAPAVMVLYSIHEMILAHQLEPLLPFTNADLYALSAKMGRKLPKKLIWLGTKQLSDCGFLIPNLGGTSALPKTYQMPPKNGTKSRRGTQPTTYQLAPLGAALESLRTKVLAWARLSMIYAANAIEKMTPEMLDNDAALAEHINQLTAHLVDKRPLVRVHRQMLTFKRLLDKTLQRLQWDQRTPIPAALEVNGEMMDMTFENTRQFRKAYYLARVGEGRQKSRRKICDEIGISDNTLTKYRRELGIKAEARFEYYPISLERPILDQIPSYIYETRESLAGCWLVSDGGEKRSLYHATLNEAASTHLALWARAEISDGHLVWVKVQVASFERMATAEEREYREVMEAIDEADSGKAKFNSNRKNAPKKDRQSRKVQPELTLGRRCPREYVRAQLQARREVLEAAAQREEGLARVLVQAGLTEGGLVVAA